MTPNFKGLRSPHYMFYSGDIGSHFTRSIQYSHLKVILGHSSRKKDNRGRIRQMLFFGELCQSSAGAAAAVPAMGALRFYLEVHLE